MPSAAPRHRRPSRRDRRRGRADRQRRRAGRWRPSRPRRRHRGRPRSSPPRAADPGPGRDLPPGRGAVPGPLSKDTCRWCGPILVDDAVRDALLWGDRHLAHDLSNWSGFVTAPLFALGGIGLAAHLDDRRGSWFDDGLVIAEAAAIAGVTNFVIKAAVARERPFVHQLAPEDKPRTDRPQDNNQSFYSGHATLTMSLAVSAGTVASMRGYRWAPAVGGRRRPVARHRLPAHRRRQALDHRRRHRLGAGGRHRLRRLPASSIAGAPRSRRSPPARRSASR
ncbi:MAG: phosphatase PAP2 family protein [Kofleriaceae bacterium]|nr:phosphatase PAP2 family protein [Kofleriaceae bacterium]